MRGTKPLFLCIILLTTIIPFTLVNGDADWLTGWDLRVKITIDSGDIDALLEDFPILVYLSNSSGYNSDDITFVFDEVGANSLKIAVTESDGTTECKVEIERWNATGEEAWLWVKVPSIAHDTNTTLYLYYDNAHADNNANVGVVGSDPAESVWDANFIDVLHLSESSTIYNDSTSNDNDFDEVGDGVTSGSQLIDGGIDLVGTNDYLKSQDSALIDTLDEATLEIMVNLDSHGADSALISDWGVGDDTIIFYYNLAGNKWRVIFRSTAETEVALFGTGNPSGSWYHVVVTYERNDFVYGYENGAQTQGDAIGNVPIKVASQLMYLGANRDASMDMNGQFDEVRISNVTRAHEWIAATYQSNLDDLVDYGEEEARLVLEVPAYLFGVGFNGSIAYVDLRWTSNLTDINFFEVQNSTDEIAWDHLGTSTTYNYTDLEVVNGTQRYYRVRACNYTDPNWDNSSFTDINFETVYFVEAAEAAEGDTIIMGGSGVFWIILIIVVPIVSYMVNKK